MLIYINLFFLACNEGYFGNSCRFQCTCEANQTCDHVTGQCISPTCPAGFTGPTCQHRKNSFKIIITKCKAEFTLMVNFFTFS